MLSIVTISYNQARYLQKCLDSVTSQLAAGDDYIVVDPGSTDGSRDMIRDYAARGKVSQTVFEKDKGPADGLNRGFEGARGEVFAFMNSDDFFLPGALDFVRRYFAGHPEVDVLVSPIKIVNADGRAELRGRAPVGLSVKGIASNRCVFVQQGMFFRSQIYRQTRGFNIANRSCWDFELFADLALAGARIRTIVRPLGAFRIHAESITGGGDHAGLSRADWDRIRKKVRRRLGWPEAMSRWESAAVQLGRLAPTRRLIELAAAFY